MVLALSTALACTLAAPGHAATISWDTDADGDWNTAGNWNPATLPGAGDDAVIDRAGANGAPPTVTHSAGATAVGSLTNNEAVAVVGGSSITTGDLSAAEGASLDVSAGASFAATGGVSVDGLSLDAQSGGRIDLSSMASYVGSATPSVA